MDKIKSLEDLIKRKEIYIKKDKLKNNEIKIIIGMATCGIAAGAKETYDSIDYEIHKNRVNNIKLLKTGCIGSCYEEPVVEIRFSDGNSVMYGNVKGYKVKDIIEKYVLGNKESRVQLEDFKNTPFLSKQYKIALRNCGVIDPENIEEYISVSGYRALANVTMSMKPNDVIEIMKKSGLRGRGGGGFPTGVKWEIAKSTESDEKYIICNADEGDPGAFMDRSILEGDPHSVLEAMAIGGYAIGSSTGYIYIRAEYPLAIEKLNIAIKKAREYGLLGNNIMGSGFDFNIELRYGAGAFVCGEETALINSIEGNRGEPNNKPPFPTQEGLWGKPTVVNNVETLANIPKIILEGAEWFNKIGSEKSKGTKVFALAGKVNNVGLVEVPMGTSLRTIIYDIADGIINNKKFKAIQTGGPSGGCIPASNLDTPIDYDSLLSIGSMMGSGGMIVMDEDDCMVNVAKFYIEFSMEESCGKCTPCRIGNKRLYEMLTKIVEGKGTLKDIEDLKKLGSSIKDTALCGLGQSSPNPVLSTINHFHDEYLEHVENKKCPAGVCSSLIQYVINSNCIGCTACARACPVGCIEGVAKKAHFINQDKCIKCGSCYATCKFKAIDRV